MVDSSLSFFGVFSIFFIISLGIIIVLWIMMPYSVFKSREILEDIKKEQEKTNKLLEGLSKKNVVAESLIETPDKSETDK